MMGTSLRTPLYDWHASHGGRIVEFGGWQMPVQYTGIVAEHQATRSGVGLFDISHMGRLRFIGPQAVPFLNTLVTKDVTKIATGRIRYALACNDQGGILDDVLVYALQDAERKPYHMLVVNAGNRLKILNWIGANLITFPGRDDFDWFDLTAEWAMIAVQGPKARELLQPLIDADLAAMKYYTGREASIAGHGGIVSRTGYTGEDGFELIVGSAAAPNVWQTLIDRGAVACGLGCRDTLRLEAAMPLYGHELNESTNPYQAGLGTSVDIDKPEFHGQAALRAVKADASQPVRVGLDVEGKRIPRENFPVLTSGDAARQVGVVTSGTFSPTLNRVIAMAYVEPTVAALGTSLVVDIRGQATPARVVKLPFYQRPKT